MARGRDITVRGCLPPRPRQPSATPAVVGITAEGAVPAWESHP